MFIAVWGQFGPTLEDVLHIMALSMYSETNGMGLILEREDNDKLQ